MASDPLTRRDAGIAVVGAGPEGHGRILRANHALAALLARPLPSLVGTRLCEHLHRDDQARVARALSRLLTSPETLYEADARLVAAAGREVRVHAVASVITMRDGRAIIIRVLAPQQ